MVARLLDGVFLLPWTLGLQLVMTLVFHAHAVRIYRTYDSASGVPRTHVHYSVGAFVLYMLILLLGAVIYEGVLTGKLGRTPGKAIMQIRIAPVSSPNEPVGGKLAALRYGYYWAPYLIPVIFVVGYLLGAVNLIWCLFDNSRQCLHDKLAKTIVINWPQQSGLSQQSATDYWRS